MPQERATGDGEYSVKLQDKVTHEILLKEP